MEVTAQLQQGDKHKPITVKDTMTMVVDRMKYKQFRSESDMHKVQKLVGAPSTKLNSGEDVRGGVGQKNKKVYQNNLR